MTEKTPAPAAPHRLLRLPEVLDLVAMKRTPWLDRVRRNEAPQPVRIGRAVAWEEGEVQAWIAEKLAAR
ncbi:MAG: AlpA family phage regulatory protein [Novosphingobium sp.]